MKAQAAAKNTSWLTESLKSLGFSEQSQIDVSSSQVYAVHAIVVWSGNVFYQIVGDSDVIAWMPSSRFDIVDGSMPSDWLTNSFDEEVPFIVGPEFVVRDKEAYSDMVELVPNKVEQFRQRLQHQAPSTPDSSASAPRGGS